MFKSETQVEPIMGYLIHCHEAIDLWVQAAIRRQHYPNWPLSGCPNWPLSGLSGCADWEPTSGQPTLLCQPEPLTCNGMGDRGDLQPLSWALIIIVAELLHGDLLVSVISWSLLRSVRPQKKDQKLKKLSFIKHPSSISVRSIWETLEMPSNPIQVDT